jgi:hypothetical protein
MTNHVTGGEVAEERKKDKKMAKRKLYIKRNITLINRSTEAATLLILSRVEVCCRMTYKGGLGMDDWIY